MRVLLLSNHLNYGGVAVYIVNLSRALKAQGGVEVFVASRGGDLEDALRRVGVRHFSIPLKTKCELSPKVFISFLQLLSFIRENKIDAIHANTRVTQVLAALLSQRTGRPYLSTCHGYFKPRLSRRLIPCWGRKVIAVSEQVRQHLLEDFHIGLQNIEVIYNGVDLDSFRPRSPQEVLAEKARLGLDPHKKVVGHIGRLSSVKGQKFLVLAARLIAAERQDVEFLIIGDGEEERPLKQLIQREGLGKVIFVRPSVPGTSLALSCMDIFVMPSLQEGLGISILEAQAQGVPVIASRVGGIPSIVEDNRTGILVPAENARSLAAAITRILGDGALKNRLVLDAKLQVRERFSLFLMAQKTRTLYEAVLC